MERYPYELRTWLSVSYGNPHAKDMPLTGRISNPPLPRYLKSGLWRSPGGAETPRADVQHRVSDIERRFWDPGACRTGSEPWFFLKSTITPRLDQWSLSYSSSFFARSAGRKTKIFSVLQRAMAPDFELMIAFETPFGSPSSGIVK